jgi:hypothetical protein
MLTADGHLFVACNSEVRARSVDLSSFLCYAILEMGIDAA